MEGIERRRGWAYLPGALDPASCAALRALLPPAGDAPAGGLAGGVPVRTVRRSDVLRLDDDAEHGGLYVRLAALVAAFNREVFGFRLDGFDEQLQLARYRADDAGFYDWHVDRGYSGLAARRKLSITIQLDDPAAYAGGALELNPDGNPVAAPLGRGTAVAFPSFVLHRVAPVTAGVRHALVAWIAGPDFN